VDIAGISVRAATISGTVRPRCRREKIASLRARSDIRALGMRERLGDANPEAILVARSGVSRRSANELSSRAFGNG
jgi:hypothetical protein